MFDVEKCVGGGDGSKGGGSRLSGSHYSRLELCGLGAAQCALLELFGVGHVVVQVGHQHLVQWRDGQVPLHEASLAVIVVQLRGWGEGGRSGRGHGGFGEGQTLHADIQDLS